MQFHPFGHLGNQHTARDQKPGNGGEEGVKDSVHMCLLHIFLAAQLILMYVQFTHI
jgi:hypothetical protein